MFEKVRELIVDQLGISVESITETSAFVDDLNADSLDLMQMLLAMENEFGICFDDEEITTIKTVGDAVKLLEKKSRA